MADCNFINKLSKFKRSSDSHDDDHDDKDPELQLKRPRFGSTSRSSSTDSNYDVPKFENKAKHSQKDTAFNSHSSIGQKIMGKYGHKPGLGLGINQQGLTEPIQAIGNQDKRGFGYKTSSNDVIEVDMELERISITEKAYWLQNSHNLEDTGDTLSEQVLRKGISIGPKKIKIDDEDKFCDAEVLKDILLAKKKLDNLKESEIKKSRSRANPFETIRNSIFLNRAALKMANMDKVFNYMFTKPKSKTGEEVIRSNELLYFADVCAGPGGFSEYVFYRKKWRAKGFGFTLKDENDFRLEDFFAGPCETFEPHYGEDGDGNIYKPQNIESFSSYVLKNTGELGVHFMMADGGFSVEEKSSHEIFAKQLYLCQCLVALKIVRTNGNFVVKLFDLFTPFSVGLVYLMYRSFDRISIHKPNSSRPANSERYLICQYKRNDCQDITRFLCYVNKLLCEMDKTDRDVLGLVPLSVLKEDTDFFEYIRNSNKRLGERQVVHLRNIVSYLNNIDASHSKQNEFKESCLKYWDIPNTARFDPKKVKAEHKIRELLKGDTDFLFRSSKEFTGIKLLTENNKSILDWHYAVLSNKEKGSPSFYLGLGRSNVYRLQDKNWVKVACDELQLPPDTLVYGEMVKEVNYTEKVTGQYQVNAFHIIDGLFLGGEDIRHMHISDREKHCELFAKSLSNSKMTYRTKKMKDLDELPISSSLQQIKLKNRKECIGFHIEKRRYFIPNGILFFCATNEDYRTYMSKSQKKKFYCMVKNDNEEKYWKERVLREDRDKVHREAYARISAEFKKSFHKRLILWLDKEGEADCNQDSRKLMEWNKLISAVEQEIAK